MNEQWEAKVVDRPDYMAKAIYLTRKVGANREYLLHDMATITPVAGAKPSEDPYFAMLDEDQVRALGLAINHAGYQAPNEHKIEGELNATKDHLHDMRRLVFDKGGKLNGKV